jgi:hypothetical protein
MDLGRRSKQEGLAEVRSTWHLVRLVSSTSLKRALEATCTCWVFAQHYWSRDEVSAGASASGATGGAGTRTRWWWSIISILFSPLMGHHLRRICRAYLECLQDLMAVEELPGKQHSSKTSMTGDDEALLSTGSQKHHCFDSLRVTHKDALLRVGL